ncbi:MAG: cell division protein ZapA [Burkholderiales bacterium]|nr:cell division protein ZapA [Burkholderiales bacterium]
MKQIEATILGQSYVLGCPEGGESSLLAAVAAVDTEMSAIRDAGRVKARERIAVLAALNLAYKLAEQPLAAAAAAPSASPAAAQAAHAAPADTDGVDLDALVARLDHLLQDDGLLL